ncbi:MAG: 50S ribosomal protein L18 [Cyclobacteriaceae bacterium]|tara:strand:+ start:226 stop:573 length:348 start_codon:yes stop_codon:yes gene_type:complete
MAVTKIQRRKRIKLGIRRKISGTAERPRLSVFRSNRAIYAQVIDDVKGVTMAAISSKEIGKDVLNVESSKEVGKKLAEKVKEAGLNTVVFDRNGYPYHGRVKAFAEGVREGGIKF